MLPELCLALIIVAVSARGSPNLSPPIFSTGVQSVNFANAANGTICDVTAFGAAGDGKTDDSAAFQSAFKACSRGVVYIPVGLYFIDHTINIETPGPINVRGDGWNSNILWHMDAHLFSFKGGVTASTFGDFAITSVGSDKTKLSTALYFPAGLSKTIVERILFYGAGDVPGTSPPLKAALLGTAIDMGAVSDTNYVDDCTIWFLCGTGVKIGKGSEVRISGGRIIGGYNGPTSPGKHIEDNRGVHVTGNNGGVHIVATDLIGCYEGLRMDSTNGQGSNREIFLSQATVDSNYVGVAVYDNSYLDITGIWAASSARDNIWVSGESDGAVLSLTGGTIFNGGASNQPGKDCATSDCNGLTVNSGSFSLTGVAVRGNQGRGVFVPSDKVKMYAVTGCRVFGNGQGFKVSGESYAITGNVIFGNKAASNFGSKAGGAVVENNVVNGN